MILVSVTCFLVLLPVLWVLIAMVLLVVVGTKRQLEVFDVVHAPSFTSNRLFASNVDTE